MKVGNIDGTPDEICDLFKNNGMKLSEFIESPEPPMNPIWIVIPALLFSLCCFSSIFFPFGGTGYKVGFLLALLATVWLAVAINIKWKITGATVIAGIMLFAVACIAYGVISADKVLSMIGEIQKK